MKIIYDKQYFPSGIEIESKISIEIIKAKEANREIKKILLNEVDFKCFGKYLLNFYEKARRKNLAFC